MDNEGYAVVVPVGAPTVPPPSVPPILVPGSLVPVQLAEPWRRAVAWVVDVVPFVVVGVGAVVLLRGPSAFEVLLKAMVTKNVDPKALGLPSVTMTQMPAGSALVQLLEVLAAGMVVAGLWVAYRIFALPLRGRTAGKWLLGIAVVDAADPRRHPSAGQALRRWLVPQGAALVPVPLTGLAPYLWVLKDSRHQGGHDLAARTLVVRRPRR